MRFMMLMIPEIEDTPEAWMPTPETVAAMAKYYESLSQAGVLLALDGLHASDKGARIGFSSDGDVTVTDGPFTEAKELIGGYWLIQVRSKEEAVQWATRCPGRNCTIELRQVQEVEGFPPDVQAALGGDGEPHG
jgi:hypothetical protein